MIRGHLAMLSLVFAVSPSTALAEVSTCATVYADATRNVDVYSRVLTEQNDVFSKHCETNGSVRQESTSLDLTVPIKSVNIGFNGSREEAFSEMQKFCKTYKENLARVDSLFRLNNSVVVDALRSYNQCVALERNNVRISHVATESRSLVVKVDFNPTSDNVTLQGVRYDDNLASCKSNVFGRTKTINDDTGAVVAERPFSVICTRKASTTSTGDRKFDRFELLLDTNHGAYTVAMPTEEMFGYDTASATRKAIAAATQRNIELEGDVRTLKNKLDSEVASKVGEVAALTAKMQNPRARIFTIFQGDGADIDCDMDVQSYSRQLCGDEVRTPLQTSPDRPGGRCGYRTHSWACVTYP